METTNTPNTVSELIQQNQEPLSPETIWEEYKKLGVQDQETFILNCVRMMKDFHFFVIEKMTEDKEDMSDTGRWIVDGTKWETIHNLICSMES